MDKEIALIINQAEALREETVEFLAELVRAPSQHSPGDTRLTAEICRRKLGSLGLTAEVVGEQEHAPSLIARLNPGGRPELVFNSHLDTVGLGEKEQWKYPPLGAVIENGRLYGRGAVDAKGCVAAMIMAAKALALAGLKLHGSLVLNPVAEEEVGGYKGAGYLLQEGFLKPDLAVIGESTANRVAVAEKGMYWFKVVAFGRTAHGSTPWHGINAIEKMLKFLSRLDQQVAGKLMARTHPLTPPPSLNIGMIQGGVNTNVVADRCEVKIDRRIIPTESLAQAKREIACILEELAEQDRDFRYELTTLAEGNPIETNPDEPLVKLAQEACAISGLSQELSGYQQVSDGRFFNDAGIPTIIMGPGQAMEAHTPNESIDINDLCEAVKLYAILAWQALR